MGYRNAPVGRSRPRISSFALGAAALALLLAPGAKPTVLADDPPARTESRPHRGIALSVGHAQAARAHPRSSETPDIRTHGEGGPISVRTETGTVWIRQNTAGSGEEGRYPACLVCHGEIENATANMTGINLDCTFCHGGDPFATTLEDAHVQPNGHVEYGRAIPPFDQDLDYQRFVNPSNLRVIHETCGVCHPTQAVHVIKSMMATAAGHYAGGLYQNGVVDTKTPIYGTFAVTDDDGNVPVEKGAVQSLLDLLVYTGGDPSLVSTHFAAVPSQACARCHLWSRGKGYRGAENADGVYRADGCAACHILYANDGLSQSADLAINHAEPGHAIEHVVTKQVPTEQCVHCHHRGARIGLNFTGRAQMPPRLPSGPGVAGTTDVRFNSNYHYTVPDTNPQDIHRDAGMHCIDCHVGSEIMGDSNIWGHMDQATKIECRNCHGTPGEEPTLTDNDGEPLPNVLIDDESNIILTSKVTGAEHPVTRAIDVVATNANAACAMNDNHLKADGGLECYACHSAWIPNCYGCHFERDERQAGLNLFTREYEIGKVSTNNKVFETLRRFTLGPNSEGRVAPYIVACQPIADVTAPSGEKILDFVMPATANGRSGLAHNPVNPHTIRGVGEVRSCAECHRSPPSLGLGSGQYAVARQRILAAGASGVGIYDRDSNPANPALDGALPVAGPALAMAMLPNVVDGAADFVYVARGTNGLAILQRNPEGAFELIDTINGIDAIDVSRVAGVLYVVDRDIGVRIYDNTEPGEATLLETVPIPDAVRAVPWGIHLFVAAGPQGLVVVDVADHASPFVAATVAGPIAADVQVYAHYQSGPDFAVRAYVADPGYGVWIVDLLPDYDTPELVGGLPLAGAVGLDAYTRYVTASGTEPSREHDYLYVAAGGAGLHVFDITDPDEIIEVAAIADLGGAIVDVDVASQLAPPGVDDYAYLANQSLGVQTVNVNDPREPVWIPTLTTNPGVSGVLVEVQQMDRYLDEQGNQLKENSHPFTGVFTRDDIVRILSAPIDCGTVPSPDLDGDGDVDISDLLMLLTAWGPCPAPPASCPADLDGDGTVGVTDLLTMMANWS
ncbi:MAG: hypothetical protein ACYTGG_02620 [Planctomycetota bacterium]|jgi:hypothetical protein